MFLCTVTHIAREWIKRVRLPLLHGGQLNRKIYFFPVVRVCLCLRIWSRETGSAVPSRAMYYISLKSSTWYGSMTLISD